MSDKKVTKRTRRIVMPYIHLFESASIAIQQAENSEENQFHNCMTAILFSAFCIESYLNHIGMKYFKRWKKGIERKLSPEEKLCFIASECMEFSPDFGCKPFHSFREIFKFRNTLVHGKTEELISETKQKITEEAIPPLTKWEKQCAVENARKLYTDTVEMIRLLHFHTPDTREDPFRILIPWITDIVYDESTFDNFPPTSEFLEDWRTKQHTLASYRASKKDSK